MSVRGVICPDTGRDISDLVNAAADRHGFDAVGFLGGAFAEAPHRDASGQIDGLAEHASRERAWPDVSYGLYQQTVKYYGHQVPGVVLSGTLAIDGAENRRLCREWFWDAGRAIDSAADAYAVLLAHWGTPLEAWCRWNKPSLPGSQNPNAANYRRGLALAEDYRVPEEEPVPPTDPTETTTPVWGSDKARIEEQIHLLVENQRRILQGDWDSARMFLDAIDPNMANQWTNAAFPGTPAGK